MVRALKHEGYRRTTILDVSAISEPLWREERGLSPELGQHSRMAKLEILCKDDEADTVIRIIRGAAHTGNPGDGVISVSTVDDCVSIRTGESGEAAI